MGTKKQVLFYYHTFHCVLRAVCTYVLTVHKLLCIVYAFSSSISRGLVTLVTQVVLDGNFSSIIVFIYVSSIFSLKKIFISVLLCRAIVFSNLWIEFIFLDKIRQNNCWFVLKIFKSRHLIGYVESV